MKIQQSQKEREAQLYKVVLNAVENYIEINAKNGSVDCMYQVPQFIFGQPPVDIPKTIEYILGVLNHRGFIALQISYDVIYISWELTSILKYKNIKESDPNKKRYVEDLGFVKKNIK